MPDVGGIQLLPETRRKIEVKMPGQNRSLVFSFIFIGLVIVLYAGLSAYQSSLSNSIQQLDSQLVELERSRDKTKESDLLALHSQLKVVGSVLRDHLFWSDAFTKIQALILPQTQFNTLSADVISKKILVKGFSASYTTTARQIASLYAFDSIEDIILNKVSTHPSGKVEFTMQITFNPDKLLKFLETN